MTFNELLQIYFERSNALQSYWTVYVVVVGGLLAFSSLRNEPDHVTTILITVLFTFFAYKNLGAIQDVSVQRFAILDAMKQSDTASETPAAQTARKLLEPTLNPPEVEGVKKFHWASDLLTIAALWAMERRRRRKA